MTRFFVSLRYHFLFRISFIRILSRAPRPRIQRHGNFLRRKVHNKTKRYFSLRLLREVRDRVDFLFRIKGFDQGINIVFVISFLQFYLNHNVFVSATGRDCTSAPDQ